MKETIDRLRADGLERIKAASTEADVESIRVALLGRKGEITSLLRGLKDVDAADRPAMGAELNLLKVDLTAALDSRQDEIGGGSSSVAMVGDLTLPGVPPTSGGTNHPLLSVLESICDIFYGMGFTRDDGPEV